MFAIKRSMIVHDSLSKSRNVLASLPRIFFDTEVIPSPTLNFKAVLFQLHPDCGSPASQKIFHKHGWASFSSIRLHIKLPLHFSSPGFLDFFAFLTFSLSAPLLFECSSKLLLCCSSQDDDNAVAILHWACLGYPRWPKNYRALPSARSNGQNYPELSCRIWTCSNCMIVGDSWW